MRYLHLRQTCTSLYHQHSPSQSPPSKTRLSSASSSFKRTGRHREKTLRSASLLRMWIGVPCGPLSVGAILSHNLIDNSNERTSSVGAHDSVYIRRTEREGWQKIDETWQEIEFRPRPHVGHCASPASPDWLAGNYCTLEIIAASYTSSIICVASPSRGENVRSMSQMLVSSTFLPFSS
jgi:hypothetical protein